MFNNKKSKRGFSLVELMVVVAIMGTLAAIAIPAYNEYRRSAKKSAYKADLTSLHKGWLAFGVELDSFCERDTSPEAASLGNVGMSSLNSSSLYGGQGACVGNGDATCTSADDTAVAGATTSALCTAIVFNGASCSASWNSQAGNSPGKHNFIGFGTENCIVGSPDQVNDANVQILGEENGVNTTPDTACDLNINSYKLGVYGHVSGINYYGVGIDHNGVLLDQQDVSTSQNVAKSGC